MYMESVSLLGLNNTSPTPVEGNDGMHEQINSSADKLRIALVFPPAMHPTGPPLGIASLKACIAPESSVSVRNFDLNLAYYDQAFEWLADGRLQMSILKMEKDATAKGTAAARDFFRGKDGLTRFFDLAEYNAHSRIYAGFETVLNGLFDSFCRRLLLERPIPQLARKYFDDLVEPLVAFKPHVIGLSILFSQQLFFALALASICRKTAAKIILGGATFSVMPDPGRILSTPTPVRIGSESEDLDIGALIDYLIVGEGEAGLKSLVGNLVARKSPPADVPGLVYREESKVRSNIPLAVQHLNRLPVPDFSDFSLTQYHSPIPVLPYLSSRGCPWRRCAFCTHQKTYLEYREEDAVQTVERLAFLSDKHGVSHFSLVDEMIHPRRMERLSLLLAKNGTKIFWSAYAKPSSRFTPKLFEKAYRSGLRVLMWGIESGNQRVLDLMRKGTKIEDLSAVLERAHQVGIWNLAFVIFGFPSETKSEWQDTLHFLELHRDRIDALSKSQFVLLEGSDVFRDPASYGISRIIDRPRRDPVSIAYDYEVAGGLSRDEAGTEMKESLPTLAAIGRSPYFGRFRDHLLIFASRNPDFH
jgi:anaerobic magnesium-protoporphyrin IX monomethyl ester cyclase